MTRTQRMGTDCEQLEGPGNSVSLGNAEEDAWTNIASHGIDRVTGTTERGVSSSRRVVVVHRRRLHRLRTMNSWHACACFWRVATVKAVVSSIVDLFLHQSLGKPIVSVEVGCFSIHLILILTSMDLISF